MSEPDPIIHHQNERQEHAIPEGCRILEIWNRALDPDVSIARARIAPGTATRLHRLAGVTERYLILSGTGLVGVGELPPQSVATGDLVYIPPGCPQRISNPGPDDLIFLAVCTPRFQQEAYEDIEPRV